MGKNEVGDSNDKTRSISLEWTRAMSLHENLTRVVFRYAKKLRVLVEHYKMEQKIYNY